MKKRWLSAVFAAVLALSMGGARSGEIPDGEPIGGTGGPVTLAGGDYWSATGNVADQASDVTVGDAQTVNLGNGDPSSVGFSTTLRSLQADSGGGVSTLNIESADGATASGTKAVELTVTNLVLAGTNDFALNVEAGSDGNVNRLTVDTLGDGATQAADLSFGVSQYGQLTINAIDGAGQLGNTAHSFTLDLEDGAAAIAQAATLVKGSIGASGSGTSTFQVGGAGLTLAGGVFTMDAMLSATGGGTLDIVKNAAGDYADVTVAGGMYGSVIDVRDGSTLNLGGLTVNAEVMLGTGPSSAGTLAVHGDLNVNADILDAADIDSVVHGTAAVAENRKYSVAGAGNEYLGGMTVAGALTNSGIATVKLGAAEKGRLEIAGGNIAANFNAFTIDNADIVVTSVASGSATFETMNDILDMGGSDLAIDLAAPGDEVLFRFSLGDIAVGAYSQLSGNARLSATMGEEFTVAGAAVIGGGGAGEVALAVEGVTARFDKGLTLDARGALATDTGGAVYLGTAAEGADLVLNGANRLYAASGASLALHSEHGDGRLLANAGASASFGEIDASELAAAVRAGAELAVATDANPALATTKGLHVASMDVHGGLLLGADGYNGGSATKAGVVASDGAFDVRSGGRVVADHETAFINGGGDTFTVHAGGNLIANTAAVNVSGFGSVNIDGVFTAGAIAGNALDARLQTDSDVAIGAAGSIAMTAALAGVVVAGDDETTATRIIETVAGKSIDSGAELGSTSMLGTFGYALNADATVLFVKSAAGQVRLDGTAADRRQALLNLRGMWGANQIGGGLGAIVYGVASGDIVSDGGAAGDRNAAVMDAIANPSGASVSRNTVEYVNGAHLYGVTDIAMETTRTFMSDITNRAKAVNCQFVAMRDSVGSLDAMASTAMNSRHPGRMWFGGSGMRQDANGKDGFSGYSYTSRGLVGGYDRVVAPNLAMGASFAYNRGDYEDDGALAHDSEIESFSAGLYGTYSGGGGFFGTLFAAYTYSDNDIRELRNDPSSGGAAWAVSDFRTDTWSLGGLFGRDFRLGESLTVTPAAGVNCIVAKNGDHRSYLGGVATQKVRDAKNGGVFLPVEVTVQYDMCVGAEARVRFEANGGYAYNLKKSGLDGGIDYYGLNPPGGVSIHGRDNARHSYKAGVGARYAVRNFDIGVRYDYVGRTDYGAHRVMGTVGLSF